jgi:hypothetical protein
MLVILHIKIMAGVGILQNTTHLNGKILTQIVQHHAKMTDIVCSLFGAIAQVRCVKNSVMLMI